MSITSSRQASDCSPNCPATSRPAACMQKVRNLSFSLTSCEMVRRTAGSLETTLTALTRSDSGRPEASAVASSASKKGRSMKSSWKVSGR